MSWNYCNVCKQKYSSLFSLQFRIHPASSSKYFLKHKKLMRSEHSPYQHFFSSTWMSYWQCWGYAFATLLARIKGPIRLSSKRADCGFSPRSIKSSLNCIFLVFCMEREKVSSFCAVLKLKTMELNLLGKSKIPPAAESIEFKIYKKKRGKSAIAGSVQRWVHIRKSGKTE